MNIDKDSYQSFRLIASLKKTYPFWLGVIFLSLKYVTIYKPYYSGIENWIVRLVIKFEQLMAMLI